MKIDIQLECEEILGIYAAALNRVIVTMSDADLGDVIYAAGAENILNEIGERDVISWLREQGYKVEEEE